MTLDASWPRRALCFVASAVTLASCAPPPAPPDLFAQNSVDLCGAYHLYSKDPSSAEATRIRGEIANRGIVPDGEWPAINRGEVLVGMSQCGALAAWGPPQANNQTVTATGQTIQFVYGNQAIYTNGKVVTSVQN